MRTHLPSTLKRARKLRRQMSPAEIRLWMVLKERPGGRKFRKQHPFGRFVADFYCDSAQMIIEVDGNSHNFGDQPEFDAKRDAWFRSQGVNVVRVQAKDVFRNIEGVVMHILSAADAAGPSPSLRDTSPVGGGTRLEL